ncbi:MAG: hypothetical protein ACPGWM_04510 [Flavobacteriales bacterium]
MPDQKFQEEQRFRQWWLWLILLCMNLIPIGGLLSKINNPLSTRVTITGMVIFLCTTLGLSLFFFMIKLTTEVNAKHICIKFSPFGIRKEIAWTDIKKHEVVEYGFVGGWGIRLGTKYGTVYNIKGKHGLSLELDNGTKLLIGSQKSEELDYYLKSLSDAASLH